MIEGIVLVVIIASLVAAAASTLWIGAPLIGKSATGTRRWALVVAIVGAIVVARLAVILPRWLADRAARRRLAQPSAAVPVLADVPKMTGGDGSLPMDSDTFDHGERALNFSVPELSGEVGLGRLTLRADRATTWPNSSVSEAIQPGECVAFVTRVTGIFGYGAPVIILQGDRELEQDIYLDMKNQRWATAYWTPQGLRQRLSWSRLPIKAELPLLIEVTLDRGDLRLRLNGELAGGGARLHEELVNMPISIALGAHGPFDKVLSETSFSVTYSGWALYRLPEEPGASNR